MGVSFPAWRQPSKGKKPHGLEAGDCDKRFSALQAKVFSLLVFSDSWNSPTELKHRDLKARKCLIFLNVSRAKRLSHCEQLTKRFYRAVETLQSRQIVGISLKVKKTPVLSVYQTDEKWWGKSFPQGIFLQPTKEPAMALWRGFGTRNQVLHRTKQRWFPPVPILVYSLNSQQFIYCYC